MNTAWQRRDAAATLRASSVLHGRIPPGNRRSLVKALVNAHSLKTAKNNDGRNSTDEVFMLVTFRSQAYADITMFGDIAVKLLTMMGHSGTVPGAILAEDVPAALDHLKKALAEDRSATVAAPAEKNVKDEDEESKEIPVSLVQHAFPLLELLKAAAGAQRDVMWERTA
jgi:hypothetical protein